jgi:hypothetical protein
MAGVAGRDVTVGRNQDNGENLSDWKNFSEVADYNDR